MTKPRRNAEQPVLMSLSRRESQVMAALYQHGRATAAQLLEAVPDLPSYSAVRSTLRVLQEKGRVRIAGSSGTANEYEPTEKREKVARSVAGLLLRSYFADDVRRAVAALLDESTLDLTEQELGRIEATIDRAERRPRRQ